MPKVFVPQQPSRFDAATGLWIPIMDLRPAAKYGDLVIMFNQNASRADLHDVVSVMQEHMAAFQPEDYLVALGDPAFIVAASMIASRKSNGAVRLLKWDRNERIYYPAEIRI